MTYTALVLIGAVLLLVVDGVILWRLAVNSPRGWQRKARGFVFGDPPADADEVG